MLRVTTLARTVVQSTRLSADGERKNVGVSITAQETLVPNSVTTLFGFSPTGRHETIRITEGDSGLVYNGIRYKCQI